jgi:hypothetical protein
MRTNVGLKSLIPPGFRLVDIDGNAEHLELVVRSIRSCCSCLNRAGFAGGRFV